MMNYLHSQYLAVTIFRSFYFCSGANILLFLHFCGQNDHNHRTVTKVPASDSGSVKYREQSLKILLDCFCVFRCDMEPHSITEGGERPREGDGLRDGQLDEGCGGQKVGIKRRHEQEEEGEESSPSKKRVH